MRPPPPPPPPPLPPLPPPPPPAAGGVASPGSELGTGAEEAEGGAADAAGPSPFFEAEALGALGALDAFGALGALEASGAATWAGEGGKDASVSDEWVTVDDQASKHALTFALSGLETRGRCGQYGLRDDEGQREEGDESEHAVG